MQGSHSSSFEKFGKKQKSQNEDFGKPVQGNKHRQSRREKQKQQSEYV